MSPFAIKRARTPSILVVFVSGIGLGIRTSRVRWHRQLPRRYVTRTISVTEPSDCYPLRSVMALLHATLIPINACRLSQALYVGPTLAFLARLSIKAVGEHAGCPPWPTSALGHFRLRLCGE
jgi:hypothetical protein